MTAVASRHFSRRTMLVLGISPFAGGMAQATSNALSVPDSLPDELARALKNGSPLLVLVSLPGCPFCKIAREHYLLPLQREHNVAVVQIDMRSRQMIVGFAGGQQTQDELIQSWGIKVTPTVLFFGRGGVEVAERLVGASIPDFYGAYLDERVRVARAAMN